MTCEEVSPDEFLEDTRVLDRVEELPLPLDVLTLPLEDLEANELRVTLELPVALASLWDLVGAIPLLASALTLDTEVDLNRPLRV